MSRIQGSQEITNSEDIIDSRDVIARIAYLEDSLDVPEEDRDEDEADELAALRSLAEEASGYVGDWEYGEALIRDSYFEQYAQQLAEDLDLIPQDATWPATCIDWGEAARELQMDYTSVDFGGVTYWTR